MRKIGVIFNENIDVASSGAELSSTLELESVVSIKEDNSSNEEVDQLKTVHIAEVDRAEDTSNNNEDGTIALKDVNQHDELETSYHQDNNNDIDDKDIVNYEYEDHNKGNNKLEIEVVDSYEDKKAKHFLVFEVTISLPTTVFCISLFTLFEEH